MEHNNPDKQRQEFGDFTQEHREYFLSAARGILRKEEEIEDAFQDALVATWKCLQGVREPQYLKTYLWRAVRNAALNVKWRGGKPHQAIPVGKLAVLSKDKPVLDTLAEAEEAELLRKKIERAFAQLAPVWREAIELYLVNGLSSKAIAAKLNKKHNTTKTMLYRARLELTELLGGLVEKKGKVPKGRVARDLPPLRRKTHCAQGHPLVEGNVTKFGRRQKCRTCARARGKILYHKNKGK